MILLGSTGSIGVNVLNIAKKFDIKIDVLVAGNNIKLLNNQIKEFKPRKVVIANKKDIKYVNHLNISFGLNAILESIEESNSSLVINALVGFLGLKPTLKAIECNKKLALANKESLVVCGKFINKENLIPIDSEHFGLWYLLQDKKIESMYITASGGSFRNYPLEKLKDVSIKEALNHPNWSMGNKITIDSATMTNKLFELLEARWLFDIKKVDALIEKKSIVHALVNFSDGSTTAHIAKANMTLPISYALKDRIDENILEHIDLVKMGSLEFLPIDISRYPIWEIKDHILNNTHLGVVLNAANEIGVKQFLENKIGFLDITNLSLKAINKFHNIKIDSIDDVFEIDNEVRSYCVN